MMKVYLNCSLVVISFFVCLNDSKAQISCPAVAKQAEGLMNEMRHSCRMLQQCLVRRDTCMGRDTLDSQALCETANKCMQTRESEFNDQAQCRYEWLRINLGPAFPEGVHICSFKRNPLTMQNGCPGRDLLTSTRRGVDLSSFDIPEFPQNFKKDPLLNCAGVNQSYQVHKYALRELEQYHKKICTRLSPMIARQMASIACSVSDTFNPNSSGEFALPHTDNLGTGVHTGPRDAGELPEPNLTPIPVVPNTVIR